MRLGLKLWSTNTDFYLDEAKRLYKEHLFDYLELYVVPDTLNTIEKWKTLKTKLGIPFTLHAPHFAHGVNLAKKSFEKTNFRIFKEVAQFEKELNSNYTVVHGGLDGSVEETAKQLKQLKGLKVLIENKPHKALPTLMNGDFCRGATVEEIEYIIKEAEVGFCLDVGHAICTANSLKQDQYDFLARFNDLNPTCYHLSDNFIDNEYDKHLHFGQGNYNIKRILGIINTSKNIAIETNKNNSDDLEDFIKDRDYLYKL